MTEPTLLSLIRQVRAQRHATDALDDERLRLENSLIEFVEEAWSEMANRTGKGYFVKGRDGNPAGRLKNPPEFAPQLSDIREYVTA
jgi:hypothetical protein